jgi:putative ABC transport system permease protein
MTWLLRRLLGDALAESILGDFEELAAARYPHSRIRAAVWLWIQTLGVILSAIAERVRSVVHGAPSRAARATSRWPVQWRAQIALDAGHAARMFRRSPGFTLAAVLAVTLGVGCTTAIFTVVNALLVRSLPYQDAHRLVRIEERLPAMDGGIERGSSIEAAGVPELRAQARTLTGLGIHAPIALTMTGAETVRVTGARVSPSLFTLLGAQPLLGRAFLDEEEAPGAPPTAILSFSAWHRYFHGSPDVLGQRLRLDGESFTIVGVMRSDFYFPDRQSEIWVPFILGPVIGGRWPVIARLSESADLRTAAYEVNAILSALTGEPVSERVAADRQRFAIVEAREALVAPAKPALRVLMISVGLVLLIACSNVANLLLARALVRRREIAVRRALGASGGRIIQQVLTESVMLALLGGIGGVALAVSMIEVLQSIGVGLVRRDLGPSLGIPRLDEVHIDWSTLAFTLGVSITAGVLFGVLPAIQQSRSNPMHALRGCRDTVVSVFGRLRIQDGLIVVQMAMAMTQLIAAGLQIHSFAKLSWIDPGYDPSNVLTFQVLTPDGEEPARFADDLVAALKVLPSVRAVGYASSLPMVQTAFISPLSKSPGMPRPAQSASSPTPQFPDSRAVSPGFLDALGVRIVEGRLLSSANHDGEILISRALAQSGYLGRDPVGQQVFAGGRLVEVVGVVEDVRQFGLDQAPVPQVYSLATVAGRGYFAMRTNVPPATQIANVRHVVQQLLPHAGVHNVATMDQIIASSVTRRRLYAVIMGSFAFIAAALAAVGLYGTIAYSVASRSREIGIRVALGARPARVLGMIMREAGTVAAIGVSLGLVGAISFTRSLDSMLFGLTPLDPATYAAAVCLFVAVSGVAALAAARQAATGDPVSAMRSE